MKMDTIRKYLRPQKISSRRSTFNNAFASALALHDEYDRGTVARALVHLGQDPDKDLLCVYCDKEAATWDHLYKRVDAGEYSGHGHHIRNLVPSCRTCNERKGGKSWEEWIDILSPPNALDRKSRIQLYISESGQRMGLAELEKAASKEMARYREIKRQVFTLLTEADEIAHRIRERASGAFKS